MKQTTKMSIDKIDILSQREEKKPIRFLIVIAGHDLMKIENMTQEIKYLMSLEVVKVNKMLGLLKEMTICRNDLTKLNLQNQS